MSRQSMVRAHHKIQELTWEPKYHEPVSQYGTDYTFREAQKKDPFKQVLRSYFPMQEEKNNCVYGAEDGASESLGIRSRNIRDDDGKPYSNSTARASSGPDSR